MLDCFMMLAPMKCHWAFTRSWRLGAGSDAGQTQLWSPEGCGTGETVGAKYPTVLWNGGGHEVRPFLLQHLVTSHSKYMILVGPL